MLSSEQRYLQKLLGRLAHKSTPRKTLFFVLPRIFDLLYSQHIKFDDMAIDGDGCLYNLSSLLAEGSVHNITNVQLEQTVKVCGYIGYWMVWAQDKCTLQQGMTLCVARLLIGLLPLLQKEVKVWAINCIACFLDYSRPKYPARYESLVQEVTDSLQNCVAPVILYNIDKSGTNNVSLRQSLKMVSHLLESSHTCVHDLLSAGVLRAIERQCINHKDNMVSSNAIVCLAQALDFNPATKDEDAFRIRQHVMREIGHKSLRRILPMVGAQHTLTKQGVASYFLRTFVIVSPLCTHDQHGYGWSLRRGCLANTDFLRLISKALLQLAADTKESCQPNKVLCGILWHMLLCISDLLLMLHKTDGSRQYAANTIRQMDIFSHVCCVILRWPGATNNIISEVVKLMIIILKVLLRCPDYTGNNEIFGCHNKVPPLLNACNAVLSRCNIHQTTRLHIYWVLQAAVTEDIVLTSLFDLHQHHKHKSAVSRALYTLFQHIVAETDEKCLQSGRVTWVYLLRNTTFLAKRPEILECIFQKGPEITVRFALICDDISADELSAAVSALLSTFCEHKLKFLTSMRDHTNLLQQRRMEQRHNNDIRNSRTCCKESTSDIDVINADKTQKKTQKKTQTTTQSQLCSAVSTTTIAPAQKKHQRFYDKAAISSAQDKKIWALTVLSLCSEKQFSQSVSLHNV